MIPSSLATRSSRLVLGAACLVALAVCWSCGGAPAKPFPAELTIDASAAGDPIPRIWTGGNGSSLVWWFSDNAGWHVGTQIVDRWMKRNYPSIERVREGNLFYSDDCRLWDGLTSASEWMQISADGHLPSGRIGKFDDYLANLLASGVKPHLALTGTPPPFVPANPTCTKTYQNVGDPPTDMAGWGDLVKDLMVHVHQQFPAEDMTSWLWTTWTEPDGEGHFVGRPADTAAMAVQAARAVREANAGAKLRFGNFMRPIDTSVVPVLQKTAASVSLEELPGVGLSVYTTQADDVTGFEEKLRTMRASLEAAGAGSLPLHIDETGILAIPTGNWLSATMDPFHGGPDQYAASWMAKVMQLYLQEKVASVSRWQMDDYLKMPWAPQDTSQWIKLGRYNVIDLYDTLVDAADPSQPVRALPVSGGRADDNADVYVQGVAGKDETTGEVKLLMFHHRAMGAPAGSAANATVTFTGLDAPGYWLEIYGVDQEGGGVWETLVGTDDYRKFYSSAKGDYDFDTILAALTPEKIASAQRLDGFHLLTSGTATPSGGQWSQELTLAPHAVVFLRLTPVASPSQRPELLLSFEKSLRGSNGELPIEAADLSYDRGVETTAATPFPAGSPGPSWDRPAGGPAGSGTEEFRGVRLAGPGTMAGRAAKLSYVDHPLDPRLGTLDVWVKPDWSADATALDSHVLLNWQPDASNGLQVVARDRQVLAVTWTVAGSAAEMTVPISDWRAGDWHRVSVSWDAAAAHSALWVDGIERTHLDGLDLAPLASLEARLEIGHAGGANQWDGVVDQLRIGTSGTF